MCIIDINCACIAYEYAYNIGSTMQNSLDVEYKLHPTSTSTITGACINCTFLNTFTTSCVAVVHQRISQLNSSGLMNIESSHKFTRSGDTAYGRIDGVNLTAYQIGVIGSQKSINKPVTSCKLS